MIIEGTSFKCFDLREGTVSVGEVSTRCLSVTILIGIVHRCQVRFNEEFFYSFIFTKTLSHFNWHTRIDCHVNVFVEETEILNQELCILS